MPTDDSPERPRTARDHTPDVSKRRRHHQIVASWVLGAPLLAFMVWLVVFGPPDQPLYKHRVLGVLCALLAGLLTVFFTGSLFVRKSGRTAALQGTGGLAAAVVTLVWWNMSGPASSSVTTGSAIQAGATNSPAPALRGYVPQTAVHTTDSANVVELNDSTSLRAGPHIESAAVATLREATRLHVIENLGPWLRVEVKQGQPPSTRLTP